MNEKSSRSHSIFSIILTQTHSVDQLNCESLDTNRRSKINLVDLAGSERLSQTSVTGDRLRVCSQSFRDLITTLYSIINDMILHLIFHRKVYLSINPC